MKRLLSIALAAALTLALAGCGGKSAYQKYSYEFFGTFDTVVQIMGYARSQQEFDGWAKKTEARFGELNKLYDNYNDYPGVNNIKTINDSAGKAPVKVSPEVINLIEFSRKWYKQSPGVVNVALGAVLSIWHNYREEGIAHPDEAKLPPREELEAALKHTNMDDVVVDEQAGTVFLRDPEMSLDMGSVAKGYATEVVAKELESQGWQSFVINSGGNVRAVGKPLDGVRQKWGVGITDPNNPGDAKTGASIIDTAFVAGLSVTTAGDYQRFYTVDGQRYNHIIDPNTLMPATRFRAVTVVTEDSSVSDFIDTVLFILPYDEGLEYVKSLGNVEALWILPDGTMKATDGMKAMLKNMGGATSK